VPLQFYYYWIVPYKSVYYYCGPRLTHKKWDIDSDDNTIRRGGVVCNYFLGAEQACGDDKIALVAVVVCEE